MYIYFIYIYIYIYIHTHTHTHIHICKTQPLCCMPENEKWKTINANKAKKDQVTLS